MKKVLLIILLIIFTVGCSNQQNISKNIVKTDLSVEQVNNYKSQIVNLVKKKSWEPDQDVRYRNIILPLNIDNTYYSEILKKSSDVGYDFSKYLGKEVVEGLSNIKYSNGDIAGEGRFLFAQDKIIGAYYMVGNYIYSLNEKEVFKKNIKWENVENLKKKVEFKEMVFASPKDLIYWTKYNTNSYLFSWEQNKLQELSIEKNKFITNREITLDGLYVVSMFLKDIDKDKKPELVLLVSNKPQWWDSKVSKLLVYEYGDKLKQKYTFDFDKPMWSIDFDGKDLVATSQNSIEIYALENNNFKKYYAYNKVGGVIKIDDIDNSGNQRYILRDSTGTDIFVFQRIKDGLEEIWRSYNNKSDLIGNVQVADINGDGIKEIYIQDKLGSMKKIVLQKWGFVDKKDDIKPGHICFFGDFNIDGKYEYFDKYYNKKSKETIMSYKY